MTRRLAFALAATLLAVPPAPATETSPEKAIPGVADPYKTDVFDPDADPMADIDAALAAAKASGKRVLLVMGTNTCHDSAWFANLIATDRFAAVRDRYMLIYADIGMPHVDFVRHPEVPKRFRFKIKGTPTIAILDADGRVLNRKAAPKWRNAASRSADEIYDELMEQGE
ncbi:thioredoxin family protein [Sphingopyxis panaciterrulae]|jgi:hypothetical protein|uniref:Protein-disulfide isomerase n=1 Tax=Sphingopyxis panaciterrulae TaxID=462372 RepID=A0A7W9B5I2_9SPHN|nr:thioredoxin family protein [Sphingopyxis panaciterrulae]MBB5706593.1 hypothetical protein [Sphingopyxis panaciterrulae]